MEQQNMAFVTLLSTTNYLDAVLVLNKSMQMVHSEYPLLVMVTSTIFTKEMQEIFEQHSILFEVVEPMVYSEEVQIKYKNHEASSVLNTASKLQIFSLKDWDKVVYIDADSIVLKNIDDLFQYPDGSMVKYPDDDMGFSGMFVICPRNHQEDEFYPTIIKYHNCVDGDLLGKTWFYVKESPAHQIDLTYFWHYNPNSVSSTAKAVHFCNLVKPWLDPDNEIFNDGSYVNHLYKKILSEVHTMLS